MIVCSSSECVTCSVVLLCRLVDYCSMSYYVVFGGTEEFVGVAQLFVCVLGVYISSERACFSIL